MCSAGVAIHHVADLVTEHAGELGFVVQLREEPVGDEDLAAGKAKAFSVSGSRKRWKS
jgi:hypothetical protein